MAVASDNEPVIVTSEPKLPVRSLKVIKPLSESSDTKVPVTVVEPSSLIPETVSLVVKVPETPVTINFPLIDKVGGVGDCWCSAPDSITFNDWTLPISGPKSFTVALEPPLSVDTVAVGNEP